MAQLSWNSSAPHQVLLQYRLAISRSRDLCRSQAGGMFYYLGGCFFLICLGFSPRNLGKVVILTCAYFSDGLVTTNQLCFSASEKKTRFLLIPGSSQFFQTCFLSKSSQNLDLRLAPRQLLVLLFFGHLN